MPASGCDGMKETSLGIKGFTSLITEIFVEPVSVIIAPFFKKGFIFCAHSAVALRRN